MLVFLGEQVTMRNVLEQKLLWADVLLCAIHVPPFVSFDVLSDIMGNICVYKIETIG